MLIRNLKIRLQRGHAILIVGLVLWVGTVCVYSQTYSSDLKDIRQTSKARPIGDIGGIERVADLRGFMPLSCVSIKKIIQTRENLFNYVATDVYQWYKVPTEDAAKFIYYGKEGDLTYKLIHLDTTPKRKKTALDYKPDLIPPFFTVLDENELEGQDLEWAKFSYKLATNCGKELYNEIVSSSGYDACDPVMILFTARSAILILNFRYTAIKREGTGQYLCGFEFSRSLKEYKTFYEIYSTTTFSRSMKQGFSDSVPIVSLALKLYFTGGK